MNRIRILCIALAIFTTLGVYVFASPLAAAANELPSSITAETEWSYLDDNTDPAGTEGSDGYEMLSWTLTAFDDSAWKKAVGSFGAKNDGTSNGAANMLTIPSDANGYPAAAYFFRTKVNVPDAEAVTKISGTVKYDDAVIIYINGVKLTSFNADKCVGNLSYCETSANETRNFEVTDKSILSALNDGVNTVSVSVHNANGYSSDVLFDMTALDFSTEAIPLEMLIDSTAEWQYLDNNTDPAGSEGTVGYDRTAWTAHSFDDSEWKTGANPFGSNRGATNLGNGFKASTLLEGCFGSTDSTNHPTYYFRNSFTVSSFEGVTKLVGTVEYDDAAIVYINGVRVAAFDDIARDGDGNSLKAPITSNSQYGGSNDSSPKTGRFEVTDFSILNEGENTIAVELHNGRAGSSDLWFGMKELYTTDSEVDYYTNETLALGSDETEMNFTWYSRLRDPGVLHISKASELEEGRMPEAALRFTATASESNKTGFTSNKVTVTSLEPNTEYAYMLSNTVPLSGKEINSEVFTFKTDGSGDFGFAFVGDPQLGTSGDLASDAAGWANTLEKIATEDVFSDTSFILSSGDQVNTANEENEYDALLEHDVMKSIPFVPAIGNHDSDSAAFSEHFNLPNPSEEYGRTTAGSDYYFIYGNALFMVINTNNMTAPEHRAFMEDAIAATSHLDIKWKIVLSHISIFTTGTHGKDDYIMKELGLRNTLAPIFTELDIDVVLQGHDHVYCRTYIMDGLTPVTDFSGYTYENGKDAPPTAVSEPDGVFYVTANTSSGSKTYDIAFPDEGFDAVSNQEDVPNVSKVNITDESFEIVTYRTTDMSVVDSFTITKTPPETPAYITEGEYSHTDGKYRIKLYIDNIKAQTGVFGFEYDTSVMTLDSFECEYLLTGRTSDMYTDDRTGGIYRNRWYVSETPGVDMYVDATAEKALLGTFVFSMTDYSLFDPATDFISAGCTEAKGVYSGGKYLAVPYILDLSVKHEPVDTRALSDRTVTEFDVSFAVKTSKSTGKLPYSGADYSSLLKIYVNNNGNTVKTLTESSENTSDTVNLTCKLAVGEYTAVIEKNGYIRHTFDFEVTGTPLDTDVITLTGGDIKGSYDDACGDGIVDIDDFIRVLRGLWSDSSELLKKAVDINESGAVDVIDLEIVKTAIASE